MSTEATATPMPSEGQRKTFAAKLTKFRGTLDPHEAAMLDALVQAARQAHAEGTVQVYWMTGPGMPTPGDLTVGPPGSAFTDFGLGGYTF